MRRPLTTAVATVALVVLAASPADAHAGGLSPTDARNTITGVETSGELTAVLVDAGTIVEVRDAEGRLARVAVPADPTAAPAARTWRLPVRTDAGTVVVTGRTEVIPGPSPLPWLGAVLALAGLGYLLGRSRRRVFGLSTGSVLVSGAALAHAAGSALVVSAQPFAWTFLGASGVGLVAWPLTVAGVVAAALRRDFVLFAVTLVGAMFVVAGFPDMSSFLHSQLPFAWPYDLDRALVAITVGGGAGLVAGGLTALSRRLAPDGTKNRPVRGGR